MGPGPLFNDPGLPVSQGHSLVQYELFSNSRRICYIMYAGTKLVS